MSGTRLSLSARMFFFDEKSDKWTHLHRGLGYLFVVFDPKKNHYKIVGFKSDKKPILITVLSTAIVPTQDVDTLWLEYTDTRGIQYGFALNNAEDLESLWTLLKELEAGAPAPTKPAAVPVEAVSVKPKEDSSPAPESSQAALAPVGEPVSISAPSAVEIAQGPQLAEIQMVEIEAPDTTGLDEEEALKRDNEYLERRIAQLESITAAMAEQMAEMEGFVQTLGVQRDEVAAQETGIEALTSIHSILDTIFTMESPELLASKMQIAASIV